MDPAYRLHDECKHLSAKDRALVQLKTIVECPECADALRRMVTNHFSPHELLHWVIACETARAGHHLHEMPQRSVK